MNASTIAAYRLEYSDEHLIKHGHAWLGVPLIFMGDELAVEPSEWGLHLKIRRCAKSTQDCYATSMMLWLRALAANGGIDWRVATRSTAEKFMAALSREGSSRNTVRLRMIHIQEFYRRAFDHQKIPAIPLHIKGGQRVFEITPHKKLPTDVFLSSSHVARPWLCWTMGGGFIPALV